MKKKYFSFWWIALTAITLAGLWALGVRFTQGLRVTQMTSILPWGLWVSLYIFFIGLSAGSFLISTLVYVFGVKTYERVGRLALYSAMLAMYAGVVFVLIDLGQMNRFWTVFTRRNLSSVLEWEIHFYILYSLILFAEFWFLIRPDLLRLGETTTGVKRTYYRILSLGLGHPGPEEIKRDMAFVKVLGIIGVPTAIAVHGGTGAIFAVVKARPYWFTGLFPIIFLVSALASGAALLTFITAFFGPKEKEDRQLTLSLAKLTATFLALDLFLLAVEALVGIYGDIPQHMEVYRAMMAGPFWWVFWGTQLTLGVLAPLFIIYHPWTGNSVPWVGLAGILAVQGIVGVRLNIVIPALSVPEFPQLLTAYVDPRLSNYYFPSMNEWLSSVGIVGLFTFVFILGFKLLPLTIKRAPEV